jgi:hypothetical protein
VEQICKSEFNKRIIDFFLRSTLYEIPSKRKDKLIILKAFSMIFKKNSFTEKEVNELIKDFLKKVPRMKIDHVKIRRYLVDEGFLTRTPDGSQYFRNLSVFNNIFEEGIDDINIDDVIAKAQKEIEERSEKYSKK